MSTTNPTPKVDPVIQFKPYFPAYFIIGKKGAGKSALLERMLEIYYRLGYVVLDWNSAFDLESLHWCVPNTDKGSDVAFPILLIIPRTTEIISNHRKITTIYGEQVEAVKTIYDDVPLKEIIKTAYEEKRICVFSIYLYKPEQKGQRKVSEFIKELPTVMRDEVPSYINVALGLRELADLSSNRMKTYAGDSEKESKRALNHFSRQARHARTTMILDMQNPDDVYGALVAQEDFILVKRLNKHHIPEKLGWLKKAIDEKIHYAARHYMIDSVQYISLDRISNNSFYAIWPDGHFSVHHNKEPTFRHHRTDDDAFELAGIARPKFLSKQDLEKRTEGKITEIQQKQNKKSERLKKIQEAYELYKRKKKENPDYGWFDCAKDVGFLGVDGKPSEDGIRKAVKTAIKDGLITDAGI